MMRSWPSGMKQTALSISTAIVTVFTLGDLREQTIDLTLSLLSITALRPYCSRDTGGDASPSDKERGKGGPNRVVHQRLDALHREFLQAIIPREEEGGEKGRDTGMSGWSTGGATKEKNPDLCAAVTFF